MILFPCTHCGLVIRVMGDVDEINMLIGQNSEFWPDKYVCPACKNSTKAKHEAEFSGDALVVAKVRDLTAQEYFRTQFGMGLPEEQVCTRKVIDLLFAQPVKKIIGREIAGTGRFQLEELEFESGAKAYFGASSFGALIYRVTAPHSYVEQVQDVE